MSSGRPRPRLATKGLAFVRSCSSLSLLTHSEKSPATRHAGEKNFHKKSPARCPVGQRTSILLLAADGPENASAYCRPSPDCWVSRAASSTSLYFRAPPPLEWGAHINGTRFPGGRGLCLHSPSPTGSGG